jgi:GAF domain-containing protein
MPEATPREQVEELLLLQRVAQRINSTLDLNIFLEQIVTDVAQTFGYCRSAILLKDETTERSRDYARLDRKRIGDRFRIGRSGIAGHVGKTGQTHYPPDVREDP